MIIREYRETDKEQIKTLISRVLKEFFGKCLIKYWEDFNSYVVFYVAEENSYIVGTAALLNERKNVGKVKRMYIDKEYRNHGLGQQLFDKLLEFAKSKGFKRLILTTHPKLQAALKFYIKNGFTIIKNPDYEKDFTDLKKEDVDTSETICMEKRL